MNNKLENLLLVATILNGSSAADKQLQYMLIIEIIKRIQLGQQIDKEELELMLEDVAEGRAISIRKAENLLKSTEVFYPDFEGHWHFNEELIISGKKTEFSEIVELFGDNRTGDQVVQESEDDNTKKSIINGINWMLDMVLAAKEDGNIEGLPAFFSCDGTTDHIIGFKTAGTATSDALSLICQSVEYLKDCGKTPKEIEVCIRFLLEKIQKCQCSIPGWDFGGFYPFEDQPDSYHPTVDATCLAVMALGTFYAERGSLEKEFGFSFEKQIEAVEEAVIAGLEFLFRMELADGSFGIYRYKGDVPKTQPNENCTRMVQSTMGVSKGSGIFDSKDRDVYYPKCSGVIRNTYNYLCEHKAVDENGYQLWAPYFGSNAGDYSTENVVVSTARVCRSFIPVWWQIEDERKDILKYNEDFLAYWRNCEETLKDKVGVYRFNSPSENEFSAGEYEWSSHPDMLAAFSVLQAYNLFGIALNKQDWTIINKAVLHTMALQHPHGHWDNPRAKNTPFCAVTLAAIEILEEYRKAIKE